MNGPTSSAIASADMVARIERSVRYEKTLNSETCAARCLAAQYSI